MGERRARAAGIGFVLFLLFVVRSSAMLLGGRATS
jgi:hypothetical protein